ncbi:MAG: hypothetical protein H6853_09035 [Rhodospirillales bacterium]|nr:hypothetical protein [Alphaproteobacteria bacterium]USO03645.1 MAG: hypothetical protein H6853_09035 [Rhodospirillales bacterium]
MQNPISSENISRLLPGLRAEYAIVSMPPWAWHWLDRFVMNSYPQGYRAFLQECAKVLPSDACLSPMLEDLARSYRDGVYEIANDTWKTTPEEKGVAKRRIPAKSSGKRDRPMPKAQYLFRFLPHATTMDALHIRKSFHLR